MFSEKKIAPPFFELGPKAYLYGKDFIKLAKHADLLSQKYDVRIIVTPQYVDIPVVVKETRNLLVFAQHMDSLKIGRGTGAVLPEAIKSAGANGVLLNHIEKRLPFDELIRTVRRAKEVGLMTMVCADDFNSAIEVVKLEPTIVVIESPQLIGGGKRAVDEIEAITMINKSLHKICADTLILHGAGINGPEDVYKVIAAGAQGTGSTSGIMLADDPFEMLEKMIRSVRDAWNSKKK